MNFFKFWYLNGRGHLRSFETWADNKDAAWNAFGDWESKQDKEEQCFMVHELLTSISS